MQLNKSTEMFTKSDTLFSYPKEAEEMRPNNLQEISILLLASMMLCGGTESKFVISRSRH